LANELAALVVRGEKTATSDLLWYYEQLGRELWRVGNLHIVCDWEWRPVCVIETVELRIRPFKDVDERFAFDYGEGERTLACQGGTRCRIPPAAPNTPPLGRND
jgi:uncharacterized protein YhfF